MKAKPKIPKEYQYKKVPEHSKWTGYIHKEHSDLVDDGIKELGLKAFKNEIPFSDIIGDNPTICRNLYGLGSTLSRLNINGFKMFAGMFDELENHVWLPQINKADPKQRIMYTCLNCGSLKINGQFYSYLDVEHSEEEKKKQKK